MKSTNKVMPDKGFNYVDFKFNLFQRGIDFQREVYKQAALDNDFDSMCNALENLKSEVKPKAMALGMNKRIDNIERTITGFRRLPLKYRRLSPDGSVSYKLPPDSSIKIKQSFTHAFEDLIFILVRLELI